MNTNENQLEEDIPIVTEGGSTYEGENNPLSAQEINPEVQKEGERLNEIDDWINDTY